MLRFLFPRLTPAGGRGAALFSAVADQAREAHWYVEGGVPDTIDGRFRMLATIAALVIVRLEAAGKAGEAASIALTERFVEVMEAEHREMGLGDPTLGRTVRKLVGSLSRRADLWRSAVAGQIDWDDAARESLSGERSGTGATHGGDRLRSFWSALQATDCAALTEGRIR
jgi:cytochrome b pre-mRNA-processing protein 3